MAPDARAPRREYLGGRSPWCRSRGGTVAEPPRGLPARCDDAGMTDGSAPHDDAEAIRALVATYGERLDAGDLDGVAALFRHARWCSGSRTLTDLDTIRRVYDDVIL